MQYCSKFKQNEILQKSFFSCFIFLDLFNFVQILCLVLPVEIQTSVVNVFTFSITPELFSSI